MTIQEVSEAKAALAESICEQITEFEEKTGVEIDRVSLERYNTTTAGDAGRHSMLGRVLLEVKLP